MIFDLEEIGPIHNWLERRASDRSGELTADDKHLDRLYWYGTALLNGRVAYPKRHIDRLKEHVSAYAGDINKLGQSDCQMMESLFRNDRDRVNGWVILNARRQRVLGLGNDE
ncbi:MAG: hypothetical protein ACM3YN_06985 [Parcubacteria group bacterium]